MFLRYTFHDCLLVGVLLLFFPSHFFSFTKQDAFIGFQDDTPSSVIFQATKQLTNEAYYSIEDEPEAWKKDIFERSCEILLQMASPDALVRLQKSRLADTQQELSKIYFFEQHHDSLLQFLEYHLQITDAKEGNGLLMQVNKLLCKDA